MIDALGQQLRLQKPISMISLVAAGSSSRFDRARYGDETALEDLYLRASLYKQTGNESVERDVDRSSRCVSDYLVQIGDPETDLGRIVAVWKPSFERQSTLRDVEDERLHSSEGNCHTGKQTVPKGIESLEKRRNKVL